jgi:hypothetical protein
MLMLSSLLAACASNTENPPADDVRCDYSGELAADEHVFQILHYRDGCIGEGSSLCMQEREGNRDEWWNFYHGIHGFDYQWGYTYCLKVQSRDIPDPLADGPSIEYSLLEILSKTPADASVPFTIDVIDAYLHIDKQVDGLYLISGGGSFSCPDAACFGLDGLLAQEASVQLVLAHREDKSEPMRLLGIPCSDDYMSYPDSCY